MSGNYYVPYDYAWDTPGFTAQNPVIVSPDGSPAGMLAGVNLVNLYGSFLELQTGRALDGILRLRVDGILTHVSTGQQVMGGELRTTRFTRGGFSIWLPATDDPELTPAFKYQARLTVRGHTQEFEFDLPLIEPEVSILTKISGIKPRPHSDLVGVTEIIVPEHGRSATDNIGVTETVSVVQVP